jgi:hypothetical protein
MHNGMTSPSYRLPRSVESDARAGVLVDALEGRGTPLRPDGDVTVLEVMLDDDLVAVLKAANLARRLVRGGDRIEEVLAAETRGQQLADRVTGTARGPRVSRLLLVSDDGSDGFYRRVEKLLRRHAPRLLVFRVRAGAADLASPLYGDGSGARMLLLVHKDAVSAALLAVAGALSPP